jgi:uncharacterized protein
MADSVAVVQQFYRSVAAGDIERVLTLLAPDLEWTEAERFPYYGGVWRGPKEVLDNLFVPLSKDWAGFSVTPHEFVDNAEQVVAFGEYKGTYRATGREMSAPFAHRWVVREGKIIRFNQYTDTAKVLEATIR